MLGTLVKVLSGSCPCGSCQTMHKLALETTCRRWQRSTEAGVRPPWDDDLCDADLEALARAGWSAEAVQAHVETLQAMLVALAEIHRPLPHPQEV
jgi:hypothetical protein